MARQKRSDDWGFPRWRSYGSSRQAEPVRLCDRHGCDLPGDRPAPKSPNSPERWWFCEAHAAGDTVDRVLTIFGESLDACLDARAKGQPLAHEETAEHGDPSVAAH